MTRGYFGIALYRPKTSINVGTLLRTAHIFGAHFIHTIGARYRRQPGDVLNSTLHVPLHEHDDMPAFRRSLPRDCALVAVEIADGAIPLSQHRHHERCCYLLGAEDDGLPPEVLAGCNRTLVLPGDRSLNLAVAGSIVLYDRIARGRTAQQ